MLVFLCLLLYVFPLLVMHPVSPTVLMAFSVVPVLVLGALYGHLAGIISALVISALNLGVLWGCSTGPPGINPITTGSAAELVSLLMVGALVGHHHDTRARLREELRVRQTINEQVLAAQTSLRNLILNNVDGMVVFSPAGENLFMNPAARDLLQSSPNELPLAWLEAHLKSGQPGEISLLGTDGQRRVIEVRVASTEWEGCQAWLASLRDITLQRNRDQQIRLMQMAIDHASNGIIITNPHLNGNPIIYANRGFERMTGYPVSEALGRNARFLQRADCEQPGLEQIRQAIQNQAPCKALLRNYRKDGSMFWNELEIQPILNEVDEVTYYVGVQHDVTTNLENQARLEYLSTHDSLTGLSNRAFFQSTIENASQMGRLPAVILAADVDGLKQINDRLGHASGDQLLCRAGELLTQVFRDQDVVARLGGDEFAVMMPNTSLTQGRRLLETFQNFMEIYNQENPQRAISFSCGVALLSENDTIEAVVHKADMAMYAEKARRKNKK